MEEKLRQLEERIGNLEYRLSALEMMRTTSICEHDWAEELMYTGTMTIPCRKMRCKKCLITQYIY